MSHSIELLVAVSGLVIGLSHLFRPVEWVEFFVWLRSLGRPGVLANGLLSLSTGCLIVAFHNDWTGLRSVLTVFGWLQVLKGVICLVFPAVGMKSLERVSMERAGDFRKAGIVALAVGALAAWLWMTAP